MKGFPLSLQLAGGVSARIDATRLVAHLAKAVAGGKPVLTDRVRTQLAALGLQFEGDPDSLQSINYGPSLLWLRTTRRLRSLPATADVARALGRAVDWTAPVYRLPQEKDLDALFCARPDVLLLRAQPGIEIPADGLTENRDKSRYLGGWRYFELRQRNALTLRDRLLRHAKGLEVELQYVPLRSPLLLIPDDPMFPDQWGMERIEAPRAWDLTTGDPRVVVAVIDTGCDLDHPDLRDAYFSRGTNVVDPTLDGSPVAAVPGPGFVWHGTAVAGVIAAAFNNATGVAGLAAGCRILPVAVSGGSPDQYAAAFRYAVSEGARVLNFSMAVGSYWFEMFVRPAIDEAIAAGCVVCASAGNGDGSPMVTPARYAPVVACGASQKDDARWRDLTYGWGSSFGDQLYLEAPVGVSVVAPGVDIVSTDISGPDGFSSGWPPDYLPRGPDYSSPFEATSAAAPHVSGAAALLMSLYPTLSNVEVRRVIERTAEKTGGYAYADVPGYTSGSRHPEMGYGRLNVFRALDFGDVMIRDWPGDEGIEPSTPPRDDFFSFSDIVIRPRDDGVFNPEDLSRLVRGREHTASVRVRNKGPALARGVQVGVCATPYVGTEFSYPSDWTGDDPLHVRPTPLDPVPFDLAAGTDRIVRFRFTAAQIDAMTGSTDMSWHPCLLADVTAVNDYAFASAPAGPSLQMRRNNLAQRNLSVIEASMKRLGRFPLAAGHPDNRDPDFDLIIEAGVLARLGEVHLVLADASRAFPAARQAQAFAKGELKAVRVVGGKLTKFEGKRAVRITAPRTVAELVKPAPGRFALQLAVRLPGTAKQGDRFPVRVLQRTRRGIVGGAGVVFISA